MPRDGKFIPRVDKTTRSWVRLFQMARLRNPTIEEFRVQKFDDISSDPDLQEQRVKILKELMAEGG